MYKIDVSIIGVIIAIGMSTRAVGKWIGGRIDGNAFTFALVAIVGLLFSAMLISAWYFVAGLMLVANFFAGVAIVEFTDKINTVVDSRHKAGVFSLRALLSRLVNFGYLGSLGFVVGAYSFSVYLGFTALVLFVMAIVYVVGVKIRVL